MELPGKCSSVVHNFSPSRSLSIFVSISVRLWLVPSNTAWRGAVTSVSKDRLMQALWNWDKEVSPNALEVHMSRLRAKLSDAGIEIRTIRGFGYLIEEPMRATTS